jgi:hypothetical protein
MLIRCIIDAIAREATVKNLLTVLALHSGGSRRLYRHVPQIIIHMEMNETETRAALADFARHTESLQSYALHLAECEDVDHYLSGFAAHARDRLYPKLANLADATQRIQKIVPEIREMCMTLTHDESELHSLMMHAAGALARNSVDQDLLKAFVALDIARSSERVAR